jgi:3-hydroxyisobutyrate dehydrogenase-like beta-hydroxyacid dehydrogenase
MCKNLVEKGDLSSPLTLYNRTQKRADDLCDVLGANKTKVASTIEDAVKDADIIFTCVGDDRAINDTINAALQADVKGKLFVDCSTVHPSTTNKLAKIIEEKGAEFVACPVFGAPAMAGTALRSLVSNSNAHFSTLQTAASWFVSSLGQLQQ